jgi:hypothetical protein
MEVSIPKCKGVSSLSPAFMLEINQFTDALQSATTAGQTSYSKLQMALDLEFLQAISTGSVEHSLHQVLLTRTLPPPMKSSNFTKRPMLSGSWCSLYTLEYVSLTSGVSGTCGNLPKLLKST